MATNSLIPKNAGLAAESNDLAGYFMASENFCEKYGILEGFLERARKKSDPARRINDQILFNTEAAMRAFLVQRKTNGQHVIHAEFVAVSLGEQTVLGPVAVAPRASKSRVRENRMVMLALASTHSKFKEGKCYALTVPNNWDDSRALAELGFDTSAQMSMEAKANITQLVSGIDADISVKEPCELIEANVIPLADGIDWKVGAGFNFGPSIEIELKKK